MKNKTNNKGFALLIAVMLTAILISITFTMFNISLKQMTLATSGRNSQTALYAADSGLECALFADRRIENAFVNFSSYDPISITISSMVSLKCRGSVSVLTSNTGSITVGGNTYSAVISSFTSNVEDYSSNIDNQSCAVVTISKYIVTEAGAQVVKTKIQSRGYNTCWNLNDPQRLERALEVNY